MRRKDKEITKPEDLEAILHKAQVCRLGLLDNDRAYIVPVHYGYLKGCLYIHSPSVGKKIDLIKHNPAICFEIDIDCQIQNTGIPCHWSTSYQSIIGYGTASFLNDHEEKKHALDILIDHYAHGTIYDFSKDMVDSVTVIKITINHMTGKRSA